MKIKNKNEFTLEVTLIIIALISAIYKLVVGEYALAGVAIVFIACMFLIKLGFKIIHFPLSFTLYLSLMVFMSFAMILGKVWNFYGIIPLWDLYLHLFSGFMIGVFGYVFLYYISDYNTSIVTNYKLAAWFVFLFAVAAAGVWEMYEFTGDQLFGLKSQNNDLMDTMTDIIAGTIGALPVVIMLLINFKGKRIKFIENLIKK